LTVEIPGYQIEGVIGKGAMGMVYKATQLSMKRTVAIKVLSEEYASDEQFTKRFLDEARAMGKLRHENIVSAIDAGCSDGTFYFVMDFVDGKTVDILLRQKKKFDVEEAFRIAKQVAEALDYAHSKGIVHRDVKPGNIIIDKTGVAKLCDLGLARPKGGMLDDKERGKAEGTPFYISPEQALGEANIDHRSDIYSLGASLYHMVTGQPPFQGGDVKETMRMHIEAPLTPVRKVAPEVDERFAKIIEKMLSKEREKRYQSAREVADDIEAVLSGKEPQMGKSSRLKEVINHKFFVPAMIVAGGVIAFLILILTGGAKAESKTATSIPHKIEKKKVERIERGKEQPKVVVEEPEKERKPEETQKALEADMKQIIADAKGLEDLKQKLEALLSKYKGSGVEGAIKEEIRKVSDQIKSQQDAESIRNAFVDIERILSSRDYKTAWEKLEALKVPEPLYAQKDSLREKIEEENRKEVETLSDEVDRVLEENADTQNIKDKLEDLFRRSTKQYREDLNRLKKILSTADALKKEQEAFDKFRNDYPPLLAQRKYQEAYEILRQTLEVPISDKRIRAEIDRERIKIEAVLRVLSRLKKSFDDVQGREVSCKLYNGETVTGKVIGVSGDSILFGVNDSQQGVSLFDIDVSDILMAIAKGNGGALYDSGIFLMVTGHPEKAYRFFLEARKLGVGIEKDWYDEAEIAANLADNAVLRNAFAEIETLLQKGKPEEAAKKFGELLNNNNIKIKDSFKQIVEQMRRKIRTALIEQMSAARLKGLVDATLKQKRDGEVTLEYRFSSDKQFDDWSTDKKDNSFIKKTSGGAQVGGVVFLNVLFDGDVEMEVNCLAQGEKPANIGILLKATNEGAYLFGLDFNPTGGPTLDLPHHPKGGLDKVTLPANIIVRYSDKWKTLKGVFGSYTPKMNPNAYYRIIVSHEGDKLKFTVNGVRLIEMDENFKNDEKGVVGFLSPDRSFKVTYIRIKGKVDEEWLQNQYETKVIAKYPYLGEEKEEKKK